MTSGVKRTSGWSTCGRNKGRRTALTLMWGTIAFLAVTGIILRDRIWAGYLAWELRSIELIVLEDLEPNQEGDGPSTDTLRALTREGGPKWVRGGLGGRGDVWVGDLALDRKRSRVYVGVGGEAGHQVMAVDSTGRALFRIDTGRTSDFTVDEETGNLWSLHDEWGGDPETLVHDPDGKLVARHDWSGGAIAYNRFDRSIWIVGEEVRKVSSQGREMARGPGLGGRWPDVASTHHDGSVWVVCCSWSGAGSSVLRIPPEGEPMAHIAIEPDCLALSERSGTVWLATRDRYVAMTPEGAVLSEAPRDSRGLIHKLIAP